MQARRRHLYTCSRLLWLRENNLNHRAGNIQHTADSCIFETASMYMLVSCFMFLCFCLVEVSPCGREPGLSSRTNLHEFSIRMTLHVRRFALINCTQFCGRYARDSPGRDCSWRSPVWGFPDSDSCLAWRCGLNTLV
jgi:hypothetical protein